jgi:predicted flap endonuclease-1-like 5' DNA nuclease
MRISDTRVMKMLQEAEIILSEEADEVTRIETEKLEDYIPDDLSTVYGIDQKSIKILASIGIKSKTELLNYEDITLVRKKLRISDEKMRKIFSSVGRIIEPEKVRKPISLAPLEEDVTKVKGIGVVTARKLNSVGIKTIQKLLDSKYEDVQNLTTFKTYSKWINNAAAFTDTSVSIEPPEVVEEEVSHELLGIKGIGKKTIEKLSRIEVFTKNDLILYSDQEQLRKILRMSSTRFDLFLKTLANSTD